MRAQITRIFATLETLPTVPVNRLATKLTAQGERILRAGHPWLFDGAVASVKGEGQPGDLAVIFDRKKDRFMGIGLFDPASPIRIKVLHQGEPVKINVDWFADRIETARKLRAPLLKKNTDGYRLLHGENDGLPGLVVDVYARVAVLKLYSAIWEPWLEELLPHIAKAGRVETIVRREARILSSSGGAAGKARGSSGRGRVIYGPDPWASGVADDLVAGEVIFREHNLKVVANVLAGHKTGFFLDHRHNRKRVGELAEGQDVLDVFSYAGGFSIHALRGGAYRVVSLDISAPALEMARRNVALNFGEDPRHEAIVGDAFQELDRLAKQGEQFGIVVVDPPSFAKREKEVPGALDAYRRINALAVPLVKPGGILLSASCSARVSAEDFFTTIERVLKRSGRPYRELERRFHDIDHPVSFPEGAYLKAIYYRLD